MHFPCAPGAMPGFQQGRSKACPQPPCPSASLAGAIWASNGPCSSGSEREHFMWSPHTLCKSTMHWGQLELDEGLFSALWGLQNTPGVHHQGKEHGLALRGSSNRLSDTVLRSDEWGGSESALTQLQTFRVTKVKLKCQWAELRRSREGCTPVSSTHTADTSAGNAPGNGGGNSCPSLLEPQSPREGCSLQAKSSALAPHRWFIQRKPSFRKQK